MNFIGIKFDKVPEIMLMRVSNIQSIVEGEKKEKFDVMMENGKLVTDVKLYNSNLYQIEKLVELMRLLNG